MKQKIRIAFTTYIETEVEIDKPRQGWRDGDRVAEEIGKAAKAKAEEAFSDESFSPTCDEIMNHLEYDHIEVLKPCVVDPKYEMNVITPKIDFSV